MSDRREITSFEFKEDEMGKLRFGVRNVSSLNLDTIDQFWSVYTHDCDMGDWLRHNLRDGYELLDGKIWIGHGIEGYDAPKLKEYIEKFKINGGPKAKSIIDTQVLLTEDPKLGELAVRFGLGKEGRYRYDATLQNIDAIKHCQAIISSYEPEKLKKYEGGLYHPMISYLMDLKDNANQKRLNHKLRH